MFHFRRSTLWIIIYITIPLIAILSSLENENDDTETLLGADTVNLWLLDNMTIQCSDRLCRQTLPGSDQFYFSLLLNRVPTSSVPVPENVQLMLRQQGGYFIVTVIAPAMKKSVKDVADFLTKFVPKGSQLDMVVSAPETMPELNAILEAVQEARGDSTENRVFEKSALTRLEAPAFGHPSQLPFLLWVEILKQRLAGYQVQVQWDHRVLKSYVLINSTVSTEVLTPVTDTELQPILSAYQKAASIRNRNADQLHRYAVAARVYNLPFSFFVSQPERIAQIQLSDVEQMREFTIEQIQKTRQD